MWTTGAWWLAACVQQGGTWRLTCVQPTANSEPAYPRMFRIILLVALHLFVPPQLLKPLFVCRVRASASAIHSAQRASSSVGLVCLHSVIQQIKLPPTMSTPDLEVEVVSSEWGPRRDTMYSRARPWALREHVTRGCISRAAVKSKVTRSLL